MLDPDRTLAAYKTARGDLLSAASPAGHWVGELSSSALSTATAISALALVERHAPTDSAGRLSDEAAHGRPSQVIFAGLEWLADRQNADGGWGDTDRSVSNVATTLLVKAAFHLTCVPTDHRDLLERADRYIASQNGLAGLRERYGQDKTFAAPILANGALAGIVPWSEVPSLPFELACFPQSWWKRLRLPVVSYAIPALVAIGQAKYFFRKPLWPLARLMRRAAVEPSLRIVEQMQPESGGFLEATPLTSFVVMSLAAIGQVDHPVVRRGVEFLLASVRPDGSWPIDTDLATWNTTLALNALSAGGDEPMPPGCLEWLLSCQHRHVHPYTGAQPGGWAWTDKSGGVPDADDTSGALLALASALRAVDAPTAERVRQAGRLGVDWLLNLQNRDGGWPTFARGWGKLPFDRSGADLTAHALRALRAWSGLLGEEFNARWASASQRGIDYLLRCQRADGSWAPLWFGNQHQPDEANPIYGTARVLAALRDLGRLDNAAAGRALDYLAAAQNNDGGWGGRPTLGEEPARSSVEETALAAEALQSCGRAVAHEAAAEKGLAWLVDAIEQNAHQRAWPIGFYFARLWYHEKLYPLCFAVAALGQAVRRLGPRPAATIPSLQLVPQQ
jgi:squalene-hopene/tetraprenyl-beta-curcumene cyclase